MSAVNGSAERAPARRTSLIADGALAAVLAVVLSVGTYFAAWHQHSHRAVDAGAIALVIASAGALALRRRYPVAVLALVFGTTLIYFVLGYASGPIWLALMVAYYTATACGHRLAAVVAAVAGFAIFPWLGYLLRDGPAPSLAALAAWLLVVLGARRRVDSCACEVEVMSSPGGSVWWSAPDARDRQCGVSSGRRRLSPCPGRRTAARHGPVGYHRGSSRRCIRQPTADGRR